MSPTAPSTPQVGDVRTLLGVTYTVAAPCQETAGNWACLTHQLTFPNNLAANLHEQEAGGHELVWHCYAHGLEADQHVVEG